MHRNMQLIPYQNDEVVLYMDDVSGTNIVLQELRNHGAGKPNRLLAGTSRMAPLPNNPAALLETDNNPARNQPPSYGPEIDDLEPGNKTLGGRRNNDDDRGGIDDGLLPTSSQYPRPGGRFPFDVNIYQQKKTLAQGMMDLALISANANQFRYVLQSSGHPYYLASLAMIGTSLFLQIVVGIGLIWNSTYNVKKYTQVHQANKANNWTVIGIFLVTILNVFISSFGVTEPSNANGIVSGPLKIGDEVTRTETLSETLNE